MKESGILLVKKPVGITSYDVIRILKKKLEVSKIGHAGTLDPFASGLMIIGINEATKILPYLENETKEYIAELTLGKDTDTFDVTGNLINEKKPKKYSNEEIKKVLNTFIGKIKQIPPIYSAIKLHGKPLYKYARNKVDIKLKEREQIIYDIKLIRYFDNKIIFYVKCNKGTYIRSLGVDIAHKLNEYGYLSNLERVAIGKFHILNVKKAEDIEVRRMISIKDALPFNKVDYPNSKDILNGKAIKLDYCDDLIAIVNKNIVLAIYQFDKKDKLYHCKRGFRYESI